VKREQKGLSTKEQGESKEMKREIKYLIDQIENDVVLKQIRSFILGILAANKKKQNN
jgi:hypothetical protein